MQGVDRRVFMRGGTAAVIGSLVFVGVGGWRSQGTSVSDTTLNPQATATRTIRSSEARSFIPGGTLEPATAPADWEVAKNYPTDTVPVSDTGEDCIIKVFPRAENAVSALSFVIRAENLTSTPNHLLVQQLTYADAAAAAQDYPRIERDARDILAAMLAIGAEKLSTDTAAEDRGRFQYMAPTRYGHALHVERRGGVICVARAHEPDALPGTFLSGLLDRVFAFDPEEGMFTVGGQKWRVSYGPIDFHPSAYTPPVCE